MQLFTEMKMLRNWRMSELNEWYWCHLSGGKALSFPKFQRLAKQKQTQKTQHKNTHKKQTLNVKAHNILLSYPTLLFTLSTTTVLAMPLPCLLWDRTATAHGEKFRKASMQWVGGKRHESAEKMQLSLELKSWNKNPREGRWLEGLLLRSREHCRSD